ncbi:hypothetical protein [uncultured Tenacibaculum sp.]|uniref:hypothetical protein n=1 Tax=uncultured Tenacibaculum sp. TaxID=174713 RepID=UPI002618350A|nr:hypothetical protein [uncultured Tenacibaculum sp.]
MNLESVTSIFESYIEKKQVNYALLVSGKWGSGKTYLWKNVLSQKVKEKELKPVYVSLNGISNVKEVEGILLVNLLPDSMNNKFVKGSMNVLRNGLNALGTVFAGGIKLSDLTDGVEINLDYSKLIICFDDLERCSIPIKDILGLINDYVEHKGLKVVICAYEEEINDDEYKRIKEKVIGRTLNYKANYQDFFDSSLDVLDEVEFKTFLIERKDMIVSFFYEHDIQNLRTFNFYLNCVHEVFPMLKNQDAGIINSMLFFMLIISNEFKEGRLTCLDSGDYKGYDSPFIFNENLLRIGKKSVGEDKSDREKFVEKYLNNQEKQELFTFSEGLYDYVLTGVLAEQKITKEIENRKEKETSEEEKVLNSLMGYNFKTLENEEFEESVKKFLGYIKEGKYSMYHYPSFYKTFQYFVTNLILIKDIKEIEDVLFEGIQKAKETSEVNFLLIENLEEEPSLLDQKLIEFHYDKIKDSNRNNAINIYKYLNVIGNELSDFLNTSMVYKCLFGCLNPQEFFQKIIELSNKEMLNLNFNLKQGYKMYLNNYCESEYKFFVDFEKILKEYIASNDIKQPKRLLYGEFLTWVDEIKGKLMK